MARSRREPSIGVGMHAAVPFTRGRPALASCSTASGSTERGTATSCTRRDCHDSPPFPSAH
eukprot:4586884-Pyramimonas_sp.AAC.1